jgi:hypothetical protein
MGMKVKICQNSEICLASKAKNYGCNGRMELDMVIFFERQAYIVHIITGRMVVMFG